MKKFFLFTVVMLLGLGLVAQDNKKQGPSKKKEPRTTNVTTSKSTSPGQLMQQRLEMRRDFGIPNLTEEQRNSIKQLQLANEKEVRKNTNLLREKEARLTTLQDEDKPDQQAINKTIDEITALKGKIMKAHAEFRVKVNALLNEEQRVAFQRQNMRPLRGLTAEAGEGRAPNIRVHSTGRISGEHENFRVLTIDGEEIRDWRTMKMDNIKSIRVIKKEDGEKVVYIEEE